MEWIRLGVVAAAMAFLQGCSTAETASEVTVRIDPAQVVERAPVRPEGPRVEISDAREGVRLEKTSLGMRLGTVRFEPQENELVRQVVEAALAQAMVDAGDGATIPGPLYCGIRAFDITTPNTPVYWDVTATVTLVLRLTGIDRQVSAVATERTWVYPTREIIGRVTVAALKDVQGQARGAIAQLVRARVP